MEFISEFSLQFWADICVRIPNLSEEDQPIPMPEVHLLKNIRKEPTPPSTFAILNKIQMDFE